MQGEAPVPLRARKNLVLIRAGSKSLHLDWTLPVERSWDLVVLAYDPALMPEARPLSEGLQGAIVLDNSAEPCKFHGIHRFFTDHPEAQGYESVFMPDDDLLLNPANLDALFLIFESSGAHLGQPALTWDSYCSHFVTFQNKAFLYRYTNFIEVMAPIMKREFLATALPTFRFNKSSWGLDCLWSKMCRDQGHRVAIIDRIPVVHTRPVGGAGLYAALGVDPRQDMIQVMQTFQVPPEPATVFGGRLDERHGQPLSGHLAESLVSGLNPDLIRRPEFMQLFQASLPHLGV